VADPLKLDVVEAALGMLRIVNANMVRAIRVVSVEKGYDPREFVLAAFGGAGPMHAAHLAKDLGIARVLVPESPGILCALGLLYADVRADFGRTALMKRQAAAPARINELFAELEEEALRWLQREKLSPEEAILERGVDMRYVGQDYELPVAAPGGTLEEGDVNRLEAGFHQAHAQAYGYRAPDAPTELVSFRVGLRVPSRPPRLVRREPGGPDPSAARKGTRPVYFEETGSFVDCPIYDRARLRPGNVLPGPAIIEQMDSTTVVLPGQRASVDRWRNLVITGNF
jgi:N-methylhydantoinase A